MGLFERIEARRKNGETIADHTKGPTMETTEENEPTRDQGLPLLDLTSIPTLEATDIEGDPTLTMAHLEEVFAKILTREDRVSMIRAEAEKAELALRQKTAALETADAAAREATANRIVAERISPEELETARHRESQAILDLTKARNDQVHEARAVEALRDRLGVDHSLADALGEGRAAVDALLEHERSRLAGRIANEFRLAASKVAVELVTLRDLIGSSTITVQGVQLDADTIKKLLVWADAAKAESSPATRRLLDVAAYIKRTPGAIADRALSLRGHHFAYEENRGPGAPRPLWRPGEKLVVRNPHKGARGLRFEGSDEEVIVRNGETRDLTSYGIPTVPSREMIDSGDLELVKQ